MPMQNPSLTISLVTWNSQAFILECLKALFAQTRKDFTLIIVDNASRDETLSTIRNEYPHVKVLHHSSNLGFARAHNLVLTLARTPYVLVLNPDVLLAPNFLEKALPILEQHPELGSAQGKLRRFTIDMEDDLRQPVRSDILDGTGLMGTPARQFANRGEGEDDVGQYDTAQDIFGPSGACALYRRAALESVRLGREYFDEDFFAYVEDSDLAWRLQRAGWKSCYIPEALAWHYRTVQHDSSLRNTLLSRSNRTVHVRRLALANVLAVMIKNLDRGTFLRHGARIISREVGKALYVLVREPRVLPGYGRLLRLLPRYLRKRRMIQQHAHVTAKELNRYFT